MKQNRVCTNQYSVSKRFVNKQGLIREVIGCSINGLLFGNSPTIINTRGNLCEISKINGAVTASEALRLGLITQERLAIFIVNYFEKSTQTFSNLNQTFLLRCWQNFLINLLADLRKVENVDNVVKSIISILSTEYVPIVQVHGDLHLGNILFSTYTEMFYLIDFEHSKFAPIELELANSLFWQDEMSLDIKTVFNKYNGLDLQKAKKLVPVYFAEQIVLATKNKDFNKLSILFAKVSRI